MQSREGEEIIEDRPPRERKEQGAKKREKGSRFDREQKFGPSPSSHGGGDSDMTTLFVSIGKIGGMRPGDLAGLLYREANLPEGAVGRITLFPKFTLVDVRAELADDIIARCSDSKMRGKKFRIDYDRNG